MLTQQNFSCSCDTLWESDCYCNETDHTSVRHCDCQDLCEELWDSTRSSQVYEVPCRVPQIRQVSIQVWTRAFSQWGAESIRSMKGLMEVMGDAINLDIRFVAVPSNYSPLGFESEAGPREVMAGLYQMCAMRYYPDYELFLPFLYCMSRIEMLPPSAVNCSLAHNIDFQLIHECARGPEGQLLMTSTFRDFQAIHLNERLPIILMDSRLYRVGTSRSVESFISTSCFLFDYQVRQFPWWMFGFMGSILLSVAVAVVVIKQWNEESFMGFLRNLFFFESNAEIIIDEDMFNHFADDDDDDDDDGAEADNQAANASVFVDGSSDAEHSQEEAASNTQNVNSENQAFSDESGESND